MKQVKVNITVQAIMTEKDGVKYYEFGTINKSKAGVKYIQLTSAKSEEPINIMIQEISDKARDAKHYKDYQLRKLTFVHNPKKTRATVAEQVAKEEQTDIEYR